MYEIDLKTPWAPFLFNYKSNRWAIKFTYTQLRQWDNNTGFGLFHTYRRLASYYISPLLVFEMKLDVGHHGKYSLNRNTPASCRNCQQLLHFQLGFNKMPHRFCVDLRDESQSSERSISLYFSVTLFYLAGLANLCPVSSCFMVSMLKGGE